MRAAAVSYMTNPIVLYLSFLFWLAFLSQVLTSSIEVNGGLVIRMPMTYFIATSMEGLGLACLVYQLKKNKHCHNISGQTILCFTCGQLSRQTIFPEFRTSDLYLWSLKAMEMYSLALLLSISHTIFISWRNTYDSDLDIMKAKYFVMCSAICSFLYCPCGTDGSQTSKWFCFQMYMDVFALLPQMVMIGWSGCPVPSAIAHYIAAIAFSRFVDLWYWLDTFHAFKHPGSVPFSGWFEIGLNVVNLLVVSDFFCYYFKGALGKSILTEDLDVAV